MNYFCIIVHLYDKKTALRGIRGYATTNYTAIQKIATRELLRYYTKSDIMKIDVWPLTENSPEVQAYLKRKAMLKKQ